MLNFIFLRESPVIENLDKNIRKIMLNFKFTMEFSAIRNFHDLKASEARLTLPAMCQVEHQKLNHVAAERERASHTKQKI